MNLKARTANKATIFNKVPYSRRSWRSVVGINTGRDLPVLSFHNYITEYLQPAGKNPQRNAVEYFRSSGDAQETERASSGKSERNDKDKTTLVSSRGRERRKERESLRWRENSRRITGREIKAKRIKSIPP